MPTRTFRALTVALALVAAASTLSGSSRALADEPPPVTPRTTRDCAMPAEERLRVPTRGGEIAVRLTRPDCPDLRRVPVILTVTPYSAAFAQSSQDDYFVRRGYARAIADVPGTGNSGGCWDYGGKREQDALYDLVEHLGTREWSNGKVGMIGASYDGTTANAAAVAVPPHLATIVPEVAISDWYGYSYGDGIRYALMDPAQRQGLVVDEQGFDTPLVFDLAFGLVPPADRRDIRADPADPDTRAVQRLCPGVLDKLEHTLHGYDVDPDYDAFWRERGYIHDAGDVRVPVLVQGGWRDYNVKHSESTRWFTALPLDDPATEAIDGSPFTMLVMGQGAHGSADVPGWTRLLHAWFDTWLYGYDGRDGRPDTYVLAQPRSLSRTNDGVVRADATWPPPGTEPVRLHLRAGNTLSSEFGDADATALLLDTGRTTEADALNAPRGEAGEVLWFESGPLATDVRIAGTPTLHLEAIAGGASAHFTPVLFDLGPRGETPQPICTYASSVEACTISRGFLDARYRNGLAHAEPLTPVERYTADVRFIDNDWVVKAGNRIAVAVMASNTWWGVPNRDRWPTTIELGNSALLLPIVGGSAAATAAGL